MNTSTAKPSNDEPYSLVRWYLRHLIDDGKISFDHANALRDFIRFKLNLLSKPQLSSDDAGLLLAFALEDPEIWQDAIWVFKYHVCDASLELPRELLLFAAYAIDGKKPTSRGRNKRTNSFRNLMIRMIAKNLIRGGMQTKSNDSNCNISACRVIAEVLSHLGHPLTEDAVRKVVTNAETTDFEAIALKFIFKNRSEIEGQVDHAVRLSDAEK